MSHALRISAINLISHSGRQLYYNCPRKFQLSKTKTFYYRERRETKALGFGKAFGTGIQSLLAGESLATAYLRAALDYPAAIAYTPEAMKSQESLAHVHEALTVFYHTQLTELQKDWEVLNLEGLYGIELPFAIIWDYGIVERGFIDVVIQHKITKEVVVLEVKTIGSYNQSTDSQWENSPQGMMYLLVVDYLLSLKGISTNSRVIYLEYNKPNKKYTVFPFEKTKKQRGDFLTSLLKDNESRKKMLDGTPAFMSGNCTYYNRQCEYFGICTTNIPLEYPEILIPESTHCIHSLDLIYHALT